ncbi:MAG TPA: kelch repeat-containing protein, partial [Actinomycetota bacterium]|nr:kelch repeat-containing protein [Actinomycetota bacterium]
MAYLPALQGVVMYGGLVCPGWVCAPVQETWLWDGSAWERLRPASSPPPLHAAAMTYDPVRKELVLFGGETCTATDCSFSSETWTFDGSNWEKQNPLVSPIASAASAIAFDPASSRVLLSGGCAQDRCPGVVGTWSWDGTNWELEDLLTPLPRVGSQMATNPGGGIVLFGGQDVQGSTPAETWIWNESGWTQRTPASSPPGRAYGGATYDPVRNEVLLLAGSSITCALSCTGGYVKDLWAWNGQTWTQRAMGEEMRVGQSHSIAYDAARDEVVRFGG